MLADSAAAGTIRWIRSDNVCYGCARILQKGRASIAETDGSGWETAQLADLGTAESTRSFFGGEDMI